MREKMIETRQILEELQLKNVLATSSTGAIFLAGDPGSGRDVVIKMVSCAVPGAEEKVRRLFLEMAEAARSVEVPAMPRLTDHGLTPEGDGFIVMDLVEGVALDSVEDLSPFAAINILLDVLSCVEGLAAVGTAHLNLKPTNIFLSNGPSYDRAVVLGFGTSATLIHAGKGVPVPAVDPHLAPELVSGEILPWDQGWRSDLFSFGVIACGVLGAEIEANGYDRPVVELPPAVAADLPETGPLEEILGLIMEPDPRKRGLSPSDVRDPLIRALPNPPPAEKMLPPPPPTEPASASSFDPNHTDPTFVPEVSGVASVTPDPLPDPISDPAAEATVPVVVDDEDGWPEVLFDDPTLPPSLSDHEDTDVRNPIPEDVWVPEIPAVPETAPAAAPPGAGADAIARRVSRTELALVAAVVVVLMSIIAFTWPTGGDESAPEVAGLIQVDTAPSTEALVPPPTDTNLFDDLLVVQQLVDEGDLEGARAALDTLGDRVEASLGSDESALYESLVTAVTQASDKGAAVEDLRNGLRYGSIKMLRRGAAGLASLSRLEITEIDGLSADLERANRALRLHRRMWDASSGGDFVRAIAVGAELESLLPSYSGASDVREQSATALEVRAEALAAELEFADAIAVLESLTGVWPNRTGAAARIEWCRSQMALTRREESKIAGALAMGEDGDPEGGLEVLAAMTPDPRLRDEYDRVKAALLDRLAAMDSAPPVIEMASEVELVFKKNGSITVPFKVTDDYRVERVIVHARNDADDGYLQIPLEKKDDGLYHFEVTHELHDNKDVHFYVVARDRSDHVGRFQSNENPETIFRKRWFRKTR
jgi:serine/threonine protein kinase